MVTRSLLYAKGRVLPDYSGNCINIILWLVYNVILQYHLNNLLFYSIVQLLHNTVLDT